MKNKWKRILAMLLAAVLFTAVIDPSGMTTAAAGQSEEAGSEAASDADDAESGGGASGDASGDADDAVVFSAEDAGADTADVSLDETVQAQTDDSIPDAVTAAYILSNLDAAYASGDAIELVNCILVKQTIADGSYIEEDTTLDSLMSQEGYGEAILTIISAATAVYDTGDENDYFVSYADTMFTDSGYYAADWDFALNNNDGEAADGCVYDESTGLVYIPKDLCYDEDGTFCIGKIQVQFLQASVDAEFGTLASDVTASLETEDDTAQTGTDSVDILDFSTCVEAGTGLSEDELIVSVNGIPTEEYTYDSETGTVTVPCSSAAVQSVCVKVEEETMASKILDAFSPITVQADTVSYGSNSLTTIGTVTFSEEPSSGDKYTDTISYRYIESASGGNVDDYADTIYTYGSSISNSAVAAIITYLQSDTNYTKIKNYTLTTAAYKSAIAKLTGQYGDADDYIDFSAINKKISLPCGHVSTSLGKGANTAEWQSVDSMIRVLQINASQGTVVLGLLTEQTHTQSGYAIFAAKYEVEEPVPAYGSLDLRKLGEDASGNTVTSSAVSRAGAVYYVYQDSSCTKYLTSITTNTAGGNAKAVKISLQYDDDGDIASGKTAYAKGGNMVYVQEYEPPDGYYNDTTVYAVNLLANGVKTQTSTKIVYNTVYVGETDGQGEKFTTSSGSIQYVVKDTLIAVPFTITKQDSAGGSADFTGTKYKLYKSIVTDSSGNITTDSNGQPKLSSAAYTLTYDADTGTFNTLTLYPGVYYMKETAAADGYELDPTVYKLTISLSFTANSSGLDYYLITATIKYCAKVSGDTITWKGYTKSNLSFTGKNAENIGTTDYSLRMYFTVSTTKSGTRTLKLYSAKHGSTSTVADLGISAAFYDDKDGSWLELTKAADETVDVTPVTEGYAYDLAGAIYYVYTDEACTVRATDTDGNEISLETDEYGAAEKVEVDAGTYYIKEITASPGYLVTNAYGDYAAQVTVKEGESASVTVTETVDTTVPGTLTKTDSAGEAITTDRAIFRLVYYYQDEDGAYVADKTLYYETDGGSIVDFGDPAYLTDGSGTPYTDADGNIVFYAGMITIEETDAPDGYEESDTVVTLYLTVDEDGDLSFEEFTSDDACVSAESSVISDTWYGRVPICKYDAVTGESAGAGFTFLLSGTDSTGETVLQAQTTDESGYAEFTGLITGTYTITETQAAEGYILDTDTVYEVTVNQDEKSVTVTKISGSEETVLSLSDEVYVIYNQPYTRLVLEKCTTDGMAIEGVVFNLYSDGETAYGNTYDAYETSDEDGVLTFGDLEPGTYYLEETDSSGACVNGENVETAEPETVWKVIVSSDCTISVYEGTQDASGNKTFSDTASELSSGETYIVYNTLTVSLPLKKVSSKNTSVTVSGVSFRLVSEDGSYDVEKMTGSDGTCVFTGLTAGTYTLTETSAEGSDPSVIADTTAHEVVVSEDLSITIDGTVLAEGYSYTLEDAPAGQINIIKTESAEGGTVKGVTFCLKGVSAAVYDYEMEVTTDENGAASFTGLLPGTYTLTETDASASVLTADLDADGNASEDAEIPAVSTDGKIHTVIVSDDGSVSIDGSTLNASYTYHQVNDRTKGIVKVIKNWLTSNVGKLYLTSDYVLTTQDGLNVYEFPVIHLISIDGSEESESESLTE